MISIEHLRIKLTGYPDKVTGHYEAFQKNRDPERLNAFVIGLIQFLQDSGNPQKEVATLSDETDLRGEMGVDSITIAEVVFLLEEIFEIEIENSDLMQIHTVGELKKYILGKIT